jgi:hypothetical protein
MASSHSLKAEESPQAAPTNRAWRTTSITESGTRCATGGGLRANRHNRLVSTDRRRVMALA